MTWVWLLPLGALLLVLGLLVWTLLAGARLSEEAARAAYAQERERLGHPVTSPPPPPKPVSPSYRR